MGLYGNIWIFDDFLRLFWVKWWNPTVFGWLNPNCGWKIRGNHDVWWVHFFFCEWHQQSWLLFIHISSFLVGLYSPCVLLVFSLVEIFSKLVNCAVYSPSWAGAGWSKPGIIDQSSVKLKCTRPVIWMVASSSNDNGEISFLLRYCLLNSNAGWSDMVKPC